MPWTCPACQNPIRHSDIEARPRLGTVYRCHICRIELVADAMTDRLAVATMPHADDDPEDRIRH
jgi:hypothetical protein